jgi:hypothetical protein
MSVSRMSPQIDVAESRRQVVLEQALVQLGGTRLQHVIVDPAGRVVAESDLAASGSSGAAARR